MRNFNKKLKKEMQRASGDFAVWKAANADKLQMFTDSAAAEENAVFAGSAPSRQSGGTMKKTLRRRLVAVVCAAVLVVTATVVTIALAPSSRPSPGYTYSDKEVVTGELTETEAAAFTKLYPAMSLFVPEKTTTSAVRLLENNALVCAITSGRINGQANKYMVTVVAVYDKKYNYIDRAKFDNLTETLLLHNAQIAYKYEGLTERGLHRYLLTATKDGLTTYWDISCLNEGIEELLQTGF